LLAYACIDSVFHFVVFEKAERAVGQTGALWDESEEIVWANFVAEAAA
jgi:hypothetical protein